ncbi:MAG: alkaline phosphatase [Ignavibacteriaceae bacterium]
MNAFRIACFYLLLITAGFAQQADPPGNNPAAANKPKNIIILIGDGMGPTYISASVLALENDPYRKFSSSGFSVTCSADNLITDSAAGGTVLSTGHRTNNGYIGVTPENKPLLNIMEIAEKLNMSTGVVSTSSVTHATPASFVAHEISRKNEIEIAHDFLDLDLEVVLGGGYGFFTTKQDGGRREDGLNLVEKIKSTGYDYFDDADDFLKAAPSNKFYALLEKESLPHACDRDYTLGQLTEAALTALSQNENGFVLMIEGSQIDWAGHDNDEDRAISELKDFNTAVNTALGFAEKNPSTLILVTADHETGGAAITGGTLNGDDIELKFVSKGHTATMVPVFSKGPGEELFRGVQDNFMIGRMLINLIDETVKF